MTDRTLRACVSCPNIYRGDLTCPECGQPGEPMADDWVAPECLYCGGSDLRLEPMSGAVDCVGCGEGQG